MLKHKKNLFIYILLVIICFTIIKCKNQITDLKIGLKNKEINFVQNQTIYKIKTNYLHLKITLNNFKNIKTSQISDKINTDSPTVKKCSYLSNFCQSKLYSYNHFFIIS